LGTLEDTIYELEESLLRLDVRQSAEVIAERLADDFTEFSSSGRVYHYRKGDVFDADKTAELNWEIRDFVIEQLATDVVLATYKTIKHSEPRVEMKNSLRSSIWNCYDGRWKMLFHQGTLTGEFEK
jgi:hypothetical protein